MTDYRQAFCFVSFFLIKEISSYFYSICALKSSADIGLRYAGAISNTVLHPVVPSSARRLIALANARITEDVKSQNVEIKDLKMYLKPEDNACYYVANGNLAGKVDLY